MHGNFAVVSMSCTSRIILYLTQSYKSPPQFKVAKDNTINLFTLFAWLWLVADDNLV